MKLSYLTTFLICTLSSAFSEEIEKLPALEASQEEPKSLSSSDIYFKAGTSLIYQELGIGHRSRDLGVHRGNDFALNLKGVPFISWRYGFVSVEYTRLFYKESPLNAYYHKYSGVGLEVGALIGGDNRLIPIPNPKIVWGKEHETGRFSQWSVNLLPTALFAIGLLAISEGKKSKDGETCGIGTGIAVVSLMGMFEYSIGF